MSAIIAEAHTHRGASSLGISKNPDIVQEEATTISRATQARENIEDIATDEIRWRDVGSGIVARSFIGAKRMMMTTKSGPPAIDVLKRKVHDLDSGKVIDVCEPDITPDKELHR